MSSAATMARATHGHTRADHQLAAATALLRTRRRTIAKKAVMKKNQTIENLSSNAPSQSLEECDVRPTTGTR